MSCRHADVWHPHDHTVHCMQLQGGRISDVGVYAGYCNHFNIGAFMEKVSAALLLCDGQSQLLCAVAAHSHCLVAFCCCQHIPACDMTPWRLRLTLARRRLPLLQGQSMAAGQTPCQRYWPKLLKMIEDGSVRCSWIDRECACSTWLHRSWERACVHACSALRSW
jgi:hypothetical protein